MSVVACPPPEKLTAFARGELAGEELGGIAAHIDDCEICCHALKSVPDDSLAGLARAAAAEPSTVHSAAPPPRPPTPLRISQEEIPPGFIDHPRYRILGELGRGGMGRVYKAEDLLMGRLIALKVVSPHLTAKVGAVERFRREIRAAAQLKDHHIVTAHDAGEAGGSHFLVMEFVEGVSLDRLVARKGPLPVPLACMFARQAALGLQHAADKAMIHRDIKPQNLMVTRKGQVKILDFGLARFATGDEDEQPHDNRLPFGAAKEQTNLAVTNPNLLMGTPDYLSPEQAKNSHEVDPRSDIYSLGCTLYFLLTGKPPFASASTLIDKLLAHTNEEPPPIRETRFEVSEALAEVLAKMMAKNPAERYQSAGEAAAALLPFTRSDAAKEPTFEIVEAAVVTPPSLRASAEPAADDTAPPPGSPTLTDAPRPRRIRRKKRISWWKRQKRSLIGGAAVVLLAVGIAFAVHHATRPKVAAPDLSAGAKVDPGEKPPDSVENPDGGKPPKPNLPIPPTVITPQPRELKVLFILPSNGVWLDDYQPVRERLESKGVTVATASTEGDKSKPHAGPPGAPVKSGQPVPIDLFLTSTMDFSEYAAVVFTGHSVDEYMFQGRGSAAAKAALQKMQIAGKPVAAICLGQGVLAAHGVLKGKKAATCDPLSRLYPHLTGRDSGINWDGPGVKVDGTIITASGGREAREFADAIFSAIGK